MEAQNDLDTHADQCVVGLNVLIVNDFDRPVAVQGFDPNGPKIDNLRTVSAAMAYDLPDTGETVILLVHQAMHIPHLPHNLISPMQLRLNDVLVNDKPKFLTENPTAEDHAIIVTGDNPMDRLLIPLSLDGVTSIFYTRKPTVQEYESCPHYELTYETPEYNPSDTRWAEQEAAICAWLAKHSQTGDGLPVRHLHLLHWLHSVSKSLMHAIAMYSANCQSDLLLNDVSPSLIDRTFLTGMQDAV
jgi:hypothetical protein